MRRRPYTQLARQASRRMLLIALVIVLCSVTLIWATWRVADDRLRTDYANGLQQSGHEKVEHQLRQWARVTDLLASTLNFQAFLREPGLRRWAILRTYLNNMEDAFPFDDLVIRDPRGQDLFRYRQDRAGLPRLTAGETSGWVTDPSSARVFRVMQSPIWLGPEGGKGVMVAYQAVAHAELKALASEDTKLQLLLPNGHILAQSDPGPQASPPFVCKGGHLLNRGFSEYGCAELPAGVEGLRLVIAGHLPQVITPQSIIIAGLIFLLALGIAFYSVIGRWLGEVVLRVAALGHAAAQFDQRRQLDTEVTQQLAPAEKQNDEIGTLGKRLQQLMESSVQREEEARSYLTTLEILQEAVIEIDENGTLLRASPAWAAVMQEEARYDSLYEYLDPEDAELLAKQVAALFDGSKSIVSVRLRTALREDQQYWLDGRFVTLDTPVTRVCGVLRDITQTYLQERQITHMALHDALTGLPNRTLLDDRLRMAFINAQREGRKVGIGFVDLDHFKNVNDVLGHKAGDQLLLSVTQKLQGCLRASDTLARWGGDEFVVLLGEMASVEDIRLVAEKLAAGCRESMVVEGQSFPVTFSMGFSIYPDDDSNVETLLSQADRALFYAKAQGRNNIQFFSEMAKDGLGKKELYIQSRLVDAIGGRIIRPWFQSQVDISTGEVVGMEALARWHDPELGWIPPDTFIPMAENLGLIRELGDHILNQALEMQATLLSQGHNISLSVNVSRRQLFFPQFEQTLVQAVQRLGIEPRQVVLEITESVAMTEVAFSRQRLKEIHRSGFRIAIDDFGVGHSSLSQLHDMPLDELKIDISFTRRVHTPQGERMVQAIVAIAESLGIKVVAEGVEDVNTSLRLKELGVSVLQGHLCGRPMPAEEFMRQLPPRPNIVAPTGRPLLH